MKNTAKVDGMVRDPEDLIKGLTACTKADCDSCPYSDIGCSPTLAYDALTLLQWYESKDPRWIPVTERLPEEGQYVLVYDGSVQVARIEKGISVEERERMKRGEIPDPVETGWCSTGICHYRRSEAYRACDECDNNERPYCWRVYANPGTLFGQYVKYWMPLPEPPKEEDDAT